MGATVPSSAKRHKRQRQPAPNHSIHETKSGRVKKKSSNDKSKSIVKNNLGEKAVARAAEERESDVVQSNTAFQQLTCFVSHYQSANNVQLSSLEFDCLKETCIVELQAPAQTSDGNLAEQLKVVFGSSWKEMLFEKHLQPGEVDPGNPALLVISTSAIRSLEILRELRSLTKECPAAKLFSKHIKVEEQVSLLKNRINIACGTPSRIKKLIDNEALGLSRLAVIVLDLHTDVKGYSLFTLPQVRDEFWDLYKSYFHQRLLEGKLRLNLYGPLPSAASHKKKKKKKTKKKIEDGDVMNE